MVVGVGRVGSAIAWDLQQSGHVVMAIDRDVDTLAALAPSTVSGESARCDVATEPERLRGLISQAELVVCAVPGHLGLSTLRQIIEAGKHCVDISFAPENALELDALARSRGVSVVVDMGVAPGMSNWLLGHHAAHMRVSSFRCAVGGLPKARHLPFQYKAPFSPRDVIEEYTRPARFRENGKLITRPALSDLERIDVPGVGTLEAFNTDGLRSLLTTHPLIPNLVEKTLRYPGHAELILALQKAGFFSHDPIKIGTRHITPIEVTAQILIADWQLAPGEPEFTVMHISISGEEHGQPIEYRYTLYDERDPVTQYSSMARTTGFACTAMCDLILKGKWLKPGVHAPEDVAKDDGCHSELMQYLAARNVVFKREAISH